RRALVEDAHSARADQEAYDDEHDAEQNASSNDRDDPGNDQDDRDDPQDEVHGFSLPDPRVLLDEPDKRGGEAGQDDRASRCDRRPGDGISADRPARGARP